MSEEPLADRDGCLFRAMSDVGDSWTLLIAWAISRGVTRFDALQRELGVARNILSERLQKMQRYGVAEKRPIAEGARRMQYCLTDKGEAFVEAISGFRRWAATWHAVDAVGPSTAISKASNGLDAGADDHASHANGVDPAFDHRRMGHGAGRAVAGQRPAARDKS